MQKQIKTNVALLILGIASILPVLVSAVLTFKTSLQEIEPNLTFSFLVILTNIVALVAIAVWTGAKAVRFLQLRATSSDGFFAAFFSAIGLALLLVGVTVAIDLYAPTYLTLVPDQPIKFILISTFYQGFATELFYRWFALSGLAAILVLIKVPRKAAMLIAIFTTSALAGALSIPSIVPEEIRSHWSNAPFLLAIAGLFALPHIVYGLLFWKKSLAVASFAHILTFLLYNFIIYSFLRFTIL